MRRMWVVIASVLACAIITATPAMAQPSQPPTVAATTVAATQPVQPTLFAGAAGAATALPANWFSDYHTCIWGVGVPLAIMRLKPGSIKGWLKAHKWGVLDRYERHVKNACIRFIYS